jgi:hypothetical protein
MKQNNYCVTSQLVFYKWELYTHERSVVHSNPSSKKILQIAHITLCQIFYQKLWLVCLKGPLTGFLKLRCRVVESSW